MAQTEQNLKNHTRFDPAFHGFLVFGGLAMLIGSIVQEVRYPDWWGALRIFGVVWILVLMFKTRLYALKVQDRVIRLEERLRLQQILSDPLRSRIGDLSEGQLDRAAVPRIGRRGAGFGRENAQWESRP